MKDYILAARKIIVVVNICQYLTFVIVITSSCKETMPACILSAARCIVSIYHMHATICIMYILNACTNLGARIDSKSMQPTDDV